MLNQLWWQLKVYAFFSRPHNVIVFYLRKATPTATPTVLTAYDFQQLMSDTFVNLQFSDRTNIAFKLRSILLQGMRQPNKNDDVQRLRKWWDSAYHKYVHLQPKPLASRPPPSSEGPNLSDRFVKITVGNNDDDDNEEDDDDDKKVNDHDAVTTDEEDE